MLLKVEKLLKMYKIPILGAKELNYLLGVYIPRCVVIGNNVSFHHNAIGAVSQQDLLECARQVTTKCKIGNENCKGG